MLLVKEAGKFQEKKEIYLLIVVIVSGLAIAALAPAVSANWFNLFEKPVEETQKTAPPGDEKILLVHGFMDTHTTPWWDALKKNLKTAGYEDEDIYSVNLGSIPLTTVNSPKQYSSILKDKLKEIYKTSDTKVDIIAHSMGGLDARWAIEKKDCAKYVDDLITLGAPHQGTYLSYLALFTAGGRDMVPGSAFLRNLNDGQLSTGVEYTAVWSNGDELIKKNEFSKIPNEELNSVEEARNIYAGYKEHIQLVWDGDVFDEYKKYLD